MGPSQRKRKCATLSQNMRGNLTRRPLSCPKKVVAHLNVSREPKPMTDLDLKESVCPHEEPVVYFDAYCDMINYTKAVPTATANIAYFEPSLQKWAMVDNEG